MSDQNPIVMPVPLSEIAKRLHVHVKAVKKWRTHGKKNVHTGERIFCEFTWLPSGEWGITQQQYDDFLKRLNEKP